MKAAVVGRGNSTGPTQGSIPNVVVRIVNGAQPAADEPVAGQTPAQQTTFAEFVLQQLRQQRKAADPACDVVLRCGSTSSVAVHSCVLAAVSRFFHRLVQSRRPGGTLDVDVGDLFRAGGLEPHFPALVDALYEGKRLVSRQVNVNKALGQVYAALELDPSIGFEALELNIAPQRVIVTPPAAAVVTATPTAFIPEPKSLPQEQPQQHQNGAVMLKQAAPPPNVLAPTAVARNKEVAMDVSICSKCNLFFMSKEEFISHRKLRTCSRKFTCQPCGSIFNRVQALITHLADVRHGETVCSVCHFAAESQSAQENHIRKHKEDLTRPYFCHSCESRFSTRKRWDQHLPKHSTEAPHICQICNKGFKWKHALAAHTVVHSDEKQFLCQECGFSTSHSSTFKFHQRNHSGQMMRCDAVPGCMFQTTRKSNLVQHQLTHSKEKPHQCEVCGRSFSLAKNMRRHARQHDRNAISYSCNIPGCTFSSLRSDKYLEHVKRYHPPEDEKQKSVRPQQPKNEQQPLIQETKPKLTFLESTLFHNRGFNQKQPSKRTITPAIAPVSTVPTATQPSVQQQNDIKQEIKAEPKLANSLFNTVSPPNKTVTDALSSLSPLVEEPSTAVFNPDEDEVFSPEEVDAVISDTFLMNATD